MSQSQKLLILAVYITESDYEQFKRYPEVMMMDGTHRTNEEKMELFITTAKTDIIMYFVCQDARFLTLGQ